MTTSIRPATDEDVPAIRAILTAHDEGDPVPGSDVVGPYVRHLIAHHRALVSVHADEGVVGYGAVVNAGTSMHLADLFVRPDLLGQGIGRSLLDPLFGEATRRTTFASADPRALPLYVRAGMAPMWVNLYLAGESSSLPQQDPRLDIGGADPDRLAEVERRWTGADRRHDHGFWASRPGADPFLVADGEGPLAVGDAHDVPGSGRRSLGRLVIRPGADPVSATIAALHRAGGRGQVRVTMLGPNPALRLLLDHGFRIVEHDQAMASEPALIDPLHLLPNSALL